MKNIKKLLAFVAVFAMVVAGVITLVACTKPHECGHKCTVEGCGKCTSDCTDPACADKCPGNHGTVPPATHTCNSPCPVASCGKCTSTCSDPVCANNRCPGNHETPTPASKWWIDTDTGTLTENGTDYLASVTLKTASVSFSYAETYTADVNHAYIAVKYSGTAAFTEIKMWGTKDGVASEKSGMTVANVVNGWNVTKTEGTDYSVVVAQIGGYYGDAEMDIDIITNVGFAATGEVNDTIIIHDFELLANAEHSFGTPTLPDVEVIGDLMSTADVFTISKDGSNQTVAFSAAPGWNTVTAQITNYVSEYRYLYIEFTASDNFKMSVRAGNDTYLTTPWTQESFESGNGTRVIDLTNQTLGASFQLVFCFDADGNPGADYSAETPKTITFHEISFRETDPMATDEANHFRTPTGSNVTYSASDNKISYTNTRNDYYRYLEILLDNHDTDYDVLSLKLTGYNGLRLGVRVLYTYDALVEGEQQTVNGTSDLIYSGAYYSLIKTEAQTEFVFYLGAYDLQDKTITGVQLYLDVLADAGKDGNVEITLNGIEMLKSSELNLKDVTITAENAEITAGETPNFNVALTAGGEAIEGTVIYEYLKADGTYAAGLPTVAGEYTVRLYYMGTREYNYSRSTTVTLTINAGSETPEPIVPTEPIVIGDMTKDDTGAGYIVTKDENGVQTVSREVYWGLANIIVNVKDWNPSQKYLVIDMQVNGTCALGIATTAQAWPNITGEYLAITTTERTTLVFDMTGKGFSETDGNLYFHFDGSKTWGAALEDGAATTVTFYSISFSDTNPNEAA